LSIVIPAFDELAFDEAKHIYKLKGIQLPSVTTIMRPLSEALYKGIDESTLNAAADRGTAIHNAIENYVNVGIKDIPSAYIGYFDAFVKWQRDTGAQVIGTECRVYHKILRYAGTADLFCLINGKLVLIDTKTSATINRMLTGVQLAGYATAYASHGLEVQGKAILHLQQNGQYTFDPYPVNDRESLEVFVALYTIWGHIQKYKIGR
jgi:hypothetical protein